MALRVNLDSDATLADNAGLAGGADLVGDFAEYKSTERQREYTVTLFCSRVYWSKSVLAVALLLFPLTSLPQMLSGY